MYSRAVDLDKMKIYLVFIQNKRLVNFVCVQVAA